MRRTIMNVMKPAVIMSGQRCAMRPLPSPWLLGQMSWRRCVGEDRWRNNATGARRDGDKSFGEGKINLYERSVTSKEEDEMAGLSAYVHIPFCNKKCFYCDFPVVAIGLSGREGDLRRVGKNNSFDGRKRGGGENADVLMEAYVEAVLREIRSSQLVLPTTYEDGREAVEGFKRPLKTIFFGGGTPSLLPLQYMEAILEELQQKCGIAPEAEISVEADPGTFDANRLRSYALLGINRVSIGVQSFDEKLLQLCGRSHGLYDVYKAIDDAHSANLPSWSIDLITGLPTLTMDVWEKSLEAAIDASSPHMSIYDLQVEKGTPFARKYTAGESPLPSEAEAALMYSAASLMLRGAGYEHYEISNYAMPGHQCHHNHAYWNGEEYAAFGMGAASFLHGYRFSRPKRLHGYLKWVDAYASSIENAKFKDYVLPGIEAEKMSDEDTLTDMVMLQLRTSNGLSLNYIKTSYVYGDVLVTAILNGLEKWIADGLVDFDPEKMVVRLVDPKGYLLSNDIISDVFVALDEIQE